jgi:hypothetical protein
MSDLIERRKDVENLRVLLDTFPVTAILGPRQVGKTTMAKGFRPDHAFDMENPRDVVALSNPQLTLERLEGLIMIDEVQRMPSLFPLIRYLVDEHPKQRYLLLGSAAAHLRQQSGESLAGRIGYYHLTGLNLTETGPEHMQKRWLRGGFPRSYVAETDNQSLLWRNNFITTFLEKDLAALGMAIPSGVMYRFWLMLSHYHGQTLNYSELGRAFGVPDKTVKHYISILEDTFMIRLLMPWYININKRLVKSPKLYLRDSGIFHALQNIDAAFQLLVHPKIGASWEGFALEEWVSRLQRRDSEVFFYAAHSGVELDLFWQERGLHYGAEFKYVDAPRTTKSMHEAISDLSLEHLYVVYPGDRTYPLSDKITATPLTNDLIFSPVNIQQA